MEDTDDIGTTRKEDEMLIAAVKAKVLLYNSCANSQKNKQAKETAWVAIAESLQKPAYWCKTRWSKLREAYRKRKNSLHGKKGSERYRIESWCHFQALQFLDDYLLSSLTASRNLNATEELSEENLLEHDATKEVESDNSENEDAQSSSKILPKQTDSTTKRRKPTCDYNDIGPENNHSKRKKETLDEHDHFCLGLAKQMKSMTAQKAAYLKMSISTIVYKMMSPNSQADKLEF